jgi:hypothetical protein
MLSPMETLASLIARYARPGQITWIGLRRPGWPG